MADPVDTAPTTSYSDPIYDRLEAIGGRVRRARWVIIAAIVIAVIGGLFLRAQLQHRPDAISAVAFVTAQNEADETAQRKAYSDLAADDKATAFFRARAALELVELDLAAGNADSAAIWLAQAVTQAKGVDDTQLALAVRLGQASVAEDAGKLEEALADYDAVERNGMVASPTHGLVGALGAARIEMAQNKPEAAVARLEPHIERTEAELDQVVSIIRLLYWDAKRAVMGPPVTVPDPNAPAKVDVAPAVEAPPAIKPDDGQPAAVAAEGEPAAEPVAEPAAEPAAE